MAGHFVLARSDKRLKHCRSFAARAFYGWPDFKAVGDGAYARRLDLGPLHGKAEAVDIPSRYASLTQVW